MYAGTVYINVTALNFELDNYTPCPGKKEANFFL